MNVEKFKPRRHQLEIADLARMSPTAGWRVVLDATPGSGKSASVRFAFEALYERGLVQKLCWLVPNLNLAGQACSDFQSESLNNYFSIERRIRHSTNDIDPSRTLDGYSLTYSALSVDRAQINAFELHRSRYLLVADECHHLGSKTKWFAAVRPLLDLSKFHLFMSGTLSRSDRDFIADLPYKEKKTYASSEI